MKKQQILRLALVITWVWICITAVIQTYITPDISQLDLFLNIPNQVILRY